MLCSVDGGRTFATVPAPHGDHHDLWIAPEDPRRMINGNDGGANVSFDAGASWSTQSNQPTGQFYHVVADDRFPYRLYGAQQDNSTVAIASRTDHSGIGPEDWFPVGGCESGFVAPKPGDADVVYAGCYDGVITRFDRRTETVRNVSVYPENPMGWGAEGMKYRFQWTFPIVTSPHDPSTLYAGGNVLFRSDQRRAELGGDQSRPDPQRSEEARPFRRAHHQGQHLRSSTTARSSRWPSPESGVDCCGWGATTAGCTYRATRELTGPR